MKRIQKKDHRIVVVDDVLVNIQVIGRILKKQGFLISIAQSGETALEIIKNDPPDLILLDIVMPEMDGFEVCRKLKKNPVLKTIPVIFLSALTDTKDKVKGFKAGAVDYVTKPIQSEELLARINLHLTLKTLQEDLESQVLIRTQELVETNEALRKKKEDYRSTMEAVPDPIVVYDLKGRATYINPSFTRVFGWTSKELLGKKPDFVVKDEWERTQHAIKMTYEKGHITDFETRRYNKKGEVLDVSISGASYQDPLGNDIGVVVNLRDISEWKQTQEIIIQNEKMMSLGGLAAGMAHEIKNPLSAIIHNTQISLNRIFEDLPVNLKAAEELGMDIGPMRKYMDKRNIKSLLETISEAGKRITEIIDNMLSFSRKSESKFIPYSMAKLLDETVKLAEQDYDLKKKYDFRTIKIIREYDDTLPKVPCEGSKIQQVFFNILKNGGEAMTEYKDTADDTPESRFILRIMKENNMARVEIEDNGPGMDKATQKRIFEPFYTTKGTSEGTGLGLSVSYFIITKNHKGSIKVKSSPLKGTKFIIRLPLNAA